MLTKTMRCIRLAWLTIAAMVAQPVRVYAAEVRLAVAANFTEPVREIAALFEKASGHKVILSFGATGQFYAQITQGAPFEVFLSADKATVAKLVQEGHAVESTAFTYAVGRLVLFSKQKGLVDDEATLKSAAFTKLAIANPETAPYGTAAVEVMKALGLYEALKPKLVQGNNIAQAYQFVATSNAEVGFIALSQVALSDTGSRWIVPARLHSPIAQDAALLKPGAHNEAALAFLAYLTGAEARAVIENFGYSAQ